MNRPYRPINNASDPVGAAASTLTPLGAGVYRLYSDRKFHFAIGRDATVDDTPVNADTAEFVASVDGDISVIAADAETDGTVWSSIVALG